MSKIEKVLAERCHDLGPEDEAHINEVMCDMIELGSPKLRCYYSEGDVWDDETGERVWEECYKVLEGCHRLVAARRLGIPVILQVMREDDGIRPVDDLGHDEGRFEEGEETTVGYFYEAFSRDAKMRLELDAVIEEV